MPYKVDAKIVENKVIYNCRIDAPLDLVFEAWSNPHHLAQWWGPTGFTITTTSMDFSEGGLWVFVMHGPDGLNYKNRMKFVEIKKPSLILYKHLGNGDAKETEDVHFQGKVAFAKAGMGTILSMEQIFPSKAELERVEREYGAIEGGKQHLGSLARYLDRIT